MKHNEFFELIYDVTKTTAYSLDQLEVLVELGLIKLPDSPDLDVYRRHIFYLSYQWTRSDGSLYNQLFDQLGLPANNTLDGHECSYILEVIENLIPKCMDHSKKDFYTYSPYYSIFTCKIIVETRIVPSTQSTLVYINTSTCSRQTLV